MNRINKLSIIALAALALAGCNKEQELVPASPIKIGEEITITATREAKTTKTVLQDDGTSIYWEVNDQVTLFYGENKGTFTSQNTEPAAVAEFNGTLNSIMGTTEAGSSNDAKLYGVYPDNSENAVATDGTITIPFKSSQNATAGTFDRTAFPSVGVSDNLNLAFYNVGALLALTVNDDNVTSITLQSNGTATLAAETVSVKFEDGKPVIQSVSSPSSSVVLSGAFEKGKTYCLAVLPGTYAGGVTFTLAKSSGDPVVLSITNDLTVGRNQIIPVNLKKKELAIKTVWLKQSADGSAWNTYYGGTAGTDRNIAMDDDYVYIAESAATAKLWAISINDPSDVKAVNVEGVADGGAHVLTCPRVIKNTDSSVNGGKDVLVCCSLTRGGVDPKLYMWTNGIDNAPKAITLTTWATGAWYGDTFTVGGTLQDGVLFFDKTGGDNANGVVTFLLNGVPAGDAMYLVGRLKFVDALGSHGGVCAYYPYPDNINTGVYSPGRGVEVRGQNVVVNGNAKDAGGIDVTLEPLEYDEGTNGLVLGYNFAEWEGKRYVIYGNQPNSTTGYVRVRQGELTDNWAKIASTGTRLYRRDLTASGFSSGNSGMDVTARVINGELYFAAQKQNIACGVYKLVYE